MNINKDYAKINAKGIDYIQKGLASGKDMNISLIGEALSGKSWIANEIFNAVKGVKCKISAPEMCQKYEYYKFSDFSDKNENLAALRDLRHIQILVLDDIGKEFGTSNKIANAYIKRFLEDRLDFIARNPALDRVFFPPQIITVFTTSLSQTDIKNLYGNKVDKGLLAYTQIIKIKGLPISYNIITP